MLQMEILVSGLLIFPCCLDPLCFSMTWCMPVNEHCKQYVNSNWEMSKDVLWNNSHWDPPPTPLFLKITDCTNTDRQATVQAAVFVHLTPSHCHITRHSQQCVFVFSVWCFWLNPEYCITGVPVWVHAEVENAVPSKVTVAGVSGNGNLRSCCLLAVTRLSTNPFCPLYLRPHAASHCPPALPAHWPCLRPVWRNLWKRKCVKFFAVAK